MAQHIRVIARSHRLCAALLMASLGVGACASREEGATLTEPTITPGVVYSASASETLIDGAYRMLVTLSIENTTNVPVTLTYPATCPIRIRLYKPADRALVFDETRLECALEDLATVVVPPLTTRTLGSGFRRMSTMMGDSIPLAAYRVVAVPKTEATTNLEIAAGTIVIRP